MSSEINALDIYGHKICHDSMLYKLYIQQKNTNLKNELPPLKLNYRKDADQI